MEPSELFKDGNPVVSNNKEICCEEKRSKYIASNPHLKLNCKIRIDGALIKGNDVSKCDYGLWVEDGNRMILIELKGCDVDKALEQLLSTYGIFSKKFEKEHFSYRFRVVPTRVSTPDLQERLKQLKRRGFDIKIKSKELREVI